MAMTPKAANTALEAAREVLSKAQAGLSQTEADLAEAERAAADLRAQKKAQLEAHAEPGIVAGLDARIREADMVIGSHRETQTIKTGIVANAQAEADAAAERAKDAAEAHHGKLADKAEAELIRVAAAALAEFYKQSALSGRAATLRSLFKSNDLQANIVATAEELAR